LHFYQSYPLWRTFFEALDVATAISPPTNREIVTAGAKVVADVTCLPVKVYAGHVIWLRDQGRVNYVLAPAIRSVQKDALHCAKFQGLPDIIKATVPDCPPLLDIEIDVHRRKITPTEAFARLGRRFTWNPLRVRRAWAQAGEVDETYRALMTTERLTYVEALARLYPDQWKAPAPVSEPQLTVGLVGHPYCLYDDYINHDLIARLRALGVRVLTSEMVPGDDARAGIAQTTGQVRWFYENWMSGAAGHYLSMPDVDGLIAVLAFTCGPDSAMVETISRRAHALNRSCLSLILDEHGSAAGMVTRLEAFVDMLTRQKQTRAAEPPTASPETAAPPAGKPFPLSPPPAFLRSIRKPVLGFPRMGTVTIAIKSLFRGVGAQIELGPPLSSRTVALGARYSPEFICTPYKYLLGNMLEMLEAGADTLLYVDGPELCRNSAYTQMLVDVLRDLGHKFTFVTTAVLDEKIVGVAKFLRQFSPEVAWRDIVREIRLALAKMSMLDEVEKLVQYVRPRETTQGTVDKHWEEAQRRIDEAADQEALKRARADSLRKINGVLMDPALRPVTIGTTGEYYAVLEPFFNLDLERELGKLGAEVRRTLMMSDWALGMLILEALGFPRKPHIDRAAKPYLRWDVAGEGWVTVGQTVLQAQKGIDGMVETLPFTCIPEITALNILPRISRDFNLPIISFIFDEQSGRAGMKTRLEAFVDLLYRRREIKEHAPATELPAWDEAVCPRCPVSAQCSHNGSRPEGCALVRSAN
jgi:predicted nucleotide-binding protein (sugar kinase/HSP70/actin superfamily)